MDVVEEKSTAKTLVFLVSGHCILYKVGDGLISRRVEESVCDLCSTWIRIIMW